MKKFSMGLMLSSLLAIQVGCGEEAPAPPVTKPDVPAVGAATDSTTPATDAAAPATDAATPATDAAAPSEEPAKDAAP